MRGRLLALLFVAFAALQFVPGVGVGRASAADSVECPNSAACDRGQAYAAAKAAYDAYMAARPGYTWKYSGSTVTEIFYNAARKSYSPRWYYKNTLGQDGYKLGDEYWFHDCPTGTTWMETTKTCFSSAACLAKPNLTNKTFIGDHIADTLSFEGCEYVPSGDSVTLCLGEGPTPTCISPTSWKPSGNAAAEGAPSPESLQNGQACTPAGDGQTFCIKADGQHCASASTGRQICWRPGETGEKADGDVLQVRNAGAAPSTPQTSPPPGESFEPSGDPVKTTTTVAGKTITTVTQNYTTTNGTNAGGAAGDQGEKADGSGQGTSPGNTGGGSDDSDDPSKAGDATSGFADGELYAKSDKTVSSVYGDFKSHVEASPLVHAADGFFGGCESITGTCPVAVWEAAEYGIAFDLQQLCADPLASLLGFAAWALLASACVYGFKVAFL